MGWGGVEGSSPSSHTSYVNDYFSLPMRAWPDIRGLYSSLPLPLPPPFSSTACAVKLTSALVFIMFRVPGALLGVQWFLTASVSNDNNPLGDVNNVSLSENRDPGGPAVFHTKWLIQALSLRPPGLPRHHSQARHALDWKGFPIGNQGNIMNHLISGISSSGQHL